MNRPLIIILILLFLALVCIGAWLIGGKICNPAVAAAPIATGNSCGTWAYDDGDDFRVETNSYYRFRRGQSNAISSNREDFKNAINRTVEYLKSNKNRALKITGLYEATEKNMSSLGTARANNVKAILEKRGVPKDQLLNVESEVLRQDVEQSDTLCRGAYFTFHSKGNPKGTARSATSYTGAAPVIAAGKALVGKDMTIYFGTNKDELRLKTQERQDMKDIKAYMDQVPTARLQVSGHTDNRGDAAYNKKLSQGRANFTAEQLSKRFGIPMNKINAVGYGEEQPVDNTNTTAGLARNRRVEVRLIEQ